MLFFSPKPKKKVLICLEVYILSLFLYQRPQLFIQGVNDAPSAIICLKISSQKSKTH